MARKKVPLLIGEYAMRGQIRVYCPFCKHHHYHKWTEQDDIGVGSDPVRPAHCDNPNSPFLQTGYEIAAREHISWRESPPKQAQL
jgi:hypothetical protein